MDEHKFPLKVVVGNEVVTFDTAEQVPAGVQFKIYEPPKDEKDSKVIITGKARTWNNNAVD